MKMQENMNIKEMLTPGAHVVVVGIGASGVSAVRFLLGLGVKISVSEGGRLIDLEGELVRWLKEKGVYIETGGHTSELLLSADCILSSPGVPLSTPAISKARENNIPVIGELALARDYLKASVIAITGTNGKSTVTTLVGDLLQSAGRKVFVGGNIGVPLTEYLAGPQDAEVVVLEVSSYQLDSGCGFKPDVAVLLNITPDHLDRYENFEAYCDSKFSIFAHQNAGDTAIINRDDVVSGQWLAAHGSGKESWPFGARKLEFGTQRHAGNGAWLEGDDVVVAAGEREERYDLSKTALSRKPNSLNAMAAILAVRAAGCTAEEVQAGLVRFKPLRHRIEFVKEIDGVSFYDDSKATNVGAVLSALEGMEESVVLIAGGRDKGGGYDMLLETVRTKVRAMVLIGEAKDKMAAALSRATEIHFALSMEEAVRKAWSLARKGDAVLLSPACASFDMFKSYAHRGDVFQAAVAELIAKGPVGCHCSGQCVREASVA